MNKVTYRESIDKVKFPAWDFEVGIVVTSNMDASISKRDNSYERGTASAMCLVEHGQAKCLLILPYDASARTVAHECWHAVHRMLVHCGADFENETVAYHLGHLVERVVAFIEKSKKFGRTGKK